MADLPGTERGGVGVRAARQRIVDSLLPVALDPDDERELRNLGRKQADYTERRNAKIREVIAKGAGPREVGRAVGLSHASVINIVKPRKR